MQLDELTPGQGWACRFRTVTFLDAQGQPMATPQLEQGQAHPGVPGEYKSLGIILTRDVDNQRVRIRDLESDHVFVVAWSDCWDIDTVEWVDKPVNTML